MFLVFYRITQYKSYMLPSRIIFYRIGCPRFPQLRFVNCAFANFPSFFFGASDPQVCKSQNLTFCVPDVPPSFCSFANLWICKNAPPRRGRSPCHPILRLLTRNVAPDLAQDNSTPPSYATASSRVGGGFILWEES